VLFLDELLEFERRALEALRQPMEDGQVVIARATQSVAFPARFALVAAMNPCPCSYLGHPTKACACGELEITKYRSRLSGPLADRIDMQVTLTPVPLIDLDSNAAAESSSVIRSRVEAARLLQRRRYSGPRGATCNAHASGRWLLTRGQLAADARRLLVEGSESLHLSARAYHRVLRVARTVADLCQSEAVRSEHVGEALRYRQR
jgi:magnesium chelatase family protein